MKRLWFISVFLLWVSAYSFAQLNWEVRTASEFYNSYNLKKGNWRSTLTEKNIDGSPYLNDDFIEGSVFTTSQTQFVGILLRYNIFNDQIEFRSGDGPVQAMATPEIVEKIEFGEYQFEYIPYLHVKKMKYGFFVVLEKGYATLYSRLSVEFEEAKKPGGYQDAQPPKFSRRADEYYIRIGKKPALLVAGKKDLEIALSDHKKDVASFIKNNKVRPNKPETLKELVQYYNSLK
ncbi:hypothetical protein D1164_19220 [Mariniphaga sediminis]|jgi:hypothetical protein|uniref:Uncharacterized protein n=1 Tax=Mariniphaga sediminis TaxID=1628158 RepID=A0A399CYJ8_9BACT|nr:hypothetical protein [Mariniphaga sediminis]RIH63562.1 hypothetical protein D1164_19220 [Mariniphaga sediminis]